MLGTVTDGETVLDVVYKPTAGERPLHDFPLGTLTRREVAAFVVSEATGWSVVPPTVLREGPFGEGMVQEWIEPAQGVDVVAMILADDERLRPMAVFDAIVNNTDRKGGHILVLPSGGIRGVDHGVCFSTHPKLRTVLWGWRGTALTEAELAAVGAARAAIAGSPRPGLGELLAADEVDATIARADRLLETGLFPHPPEDWPAVPWPPY